MDTRNVLVQSSNRMAYPTSCPNGVPNSSLTRLATDIAATRRGWVHPILAYLFGCVGRRGRGEEREKERRTNKEGKVRGEDRADGGEEQGRKPWCTEVVFPPLLTTHRHTDAQTHTHIYTHILVSTHYRVGPPTSDSLSERTWCTHPHVGIALAASFYRSPFPRR